MLTGFKNAVEVDFTLEENKNKIEEWERSIQTGSCRSRCCLPADHRWKES